VAGIALAVAGAAGFYAVRYAGPPATLDNGEARAAALGLSTCRRSAEAATSDVPLIGDAPVGAAGSAGLRLIDSAAPEWFGRIVVS
jgi:hypothetical protein